MKNKSPYVIACAVLALDIKYAAEQLGMEVGTRFLEGGLHNRPNLLREKLQAAIDEGVPAPVISSALFSRFSSRGMDDFADKLLSAMRFEFGGHEEKKAGGG